MNRNSTRARHQERTHYRFGQAPDDERTDGLGIQAFCCRERTRLGITGFIGLAVIAALLPFGAEVAEQGSPRVVFVSSADGATATSPIQLEFGIESYEISAIPEEVDEPRSGIGHYHVGFDTECLPAGTEIPRADPWVHFGDGSVTFETLVEPGEYTFALQLGDDLHHTQEGLCETITVTVE